MDFHKLEAIFKKKVSFHFENEFEFVKDEYTINVLVKGGIESLTLSLLQSIYYQTLCPYCHSQSIFDSYISI